jgi:hypothetical protein
MPDVPAVKPKPLTHKQRRFVEAYTGNATEAARAAGYKGNDVTLAAVGSENLRKPLIAAAIAAREKPKTASLMLRRTGRQAFWASVADDPKAEMKDRLRASELLGRSEADFTEKVQHQGGVVINVVDPYALPVEEKPKVAAPRGDQQVAPK